MKYIFELLDYLLSYDINFLKFVDEKNIEIVDR